MEVIATILTMIGVWTVLSVSAFFVFGEDVAHSYNCGQVRKGHIQTAAIVGFVPAMAGLILLISLVA